MNIHRVFPRGAWFSNGKLTLEKERPDFEGERFRPFGSPRHPVSSLPATPLLISIATYPGFSCSIIKTSLSKRASSLHASPYYRYKNSFPPKRWEYSVMNFAKLMEDYFSNSFCTMTWVFAFTLQKWTHRNKEEIG